MLHFLHFNLAMATKEAAAAAEVADPLKDPNWCSTSPFLRHLWKMLHDPRNADFVCWCADGEHFKFVRADKRALDVVLKSYGHTCFATLQRQLNYFGFYKNKKLSDVKSSVTAYFHPLFRAKEPHLVSQIKRKTNNGRAKGHHTSKVHAVKSVKRKQADVTPVQPLRASKRQAFLARADGDRAATPLLQLQMPSLDDDGRLSPVDTKATQYGLFNDASLLQAELDAQELYAWSLWGALGNGRTDKSADTSWLGGSNLKDVPV